MTVLNLVYHPNEILNKVASEVTTFDEEFQTFVCDMKETMIEKYGAGLAAPQVGKSLRVFVMRIRPTGEIREFVNPEIIPVENSGTTSIMEGCLSIPGDRRSVSRQAVVLIRAVDRYGKPFEYEAKGFQAICAQHEYDHLEGKLIVDYPELDRAVVTRRGNKGLTGSHEWTYNPLTPLRVTIKL